MVETPSVIFPQGMTKTPASLLFNFILISKNQGDDYRCAVFHSKSSLYCV